MGVKQDAFWSCYDAKDVDDMPRLNRSDENCPTCCLPQQSWEAKYSAFTVAELGEILMKWGVSGEYWKLSWHVKDSYGYKWLSEADERGAQTEADARAILLI